MPYTGKVQWSLWFVDMEGAEDHLTATLTHKQVELLTAYMERMKLKGKISDYVLVKNADYGFAEMLDYIDQKLKEA